MAISIKSFLVLEKSLTRKTMAVILQQLESDIIKIIELLNSGDYTEASVLLESLSLPNIPTGYLGVIGASAVVFGASGVTPKVTRSSLVKNQPSANIEGLTALTERMIMEMTDKAVKKKLQGAILSSIKTGSEVSLTDILTEIKKVTKNILVSANSLHVSRMASYGFLLEATDKGITHYRRSAQLDDRTCPICALLDGKKFSVASTLARTHTALSAETPDDLKYLAPFPDTSKAGVERMTKLTNDEISSEGLETVPSHFRCRCVLVKV